MKTLVSLRKKQQAQIKCIHSNVLKQKLLPLGMAPGKSVVLVQKALFAGPVVVEVQHSQIMLRYDEAKLIEVEDD